MHNVTAQIPSDSLIAYWPFSGNTNDVSGNGYNGMAHGVTLTADRFGNPNSAYHFDGMSAFIEISNNQPVITTTEFTISAWANMHGEGGGMEGQQIVFAQRDDDASPANAKSTITLIPRHHDGSAIFMLRSSDNTSGPFSQLSSPSKGNREWHHYVALLGADDTVRFYIDAVEIGKIKRAQTGNFTTSVDYVNIGCHKHTEGSVRGLFYGDIDDVRIYRRGLRPDEVEALYYENICREIITVTDTLVINTKVGFNPFRYLNTVKLYPNPTNDHLNVDFGSNYSTMNGYTLSITNAAGQVVYSQPVDQQHLLIDLSTWTGNGIYFVYLRDELGNIVDVKKIVLQ